MANLNKENIITVDVKNATVKTEGSMTFYITDERTCNIYCQLVVNASKSALITKYHSVDNAEDFTVTLRLIKPNNEPKELDFILLDKADAFFYIDLTDEYKDCIGTYKCELFVDTTVNGELERVTTSSFTYRVNGSIMNDLDKVIDNMQSNPLIEALATKEYVDNIVYVIDKTEAEEGITYEDFKNGGCTCKLSGSLYFGDTYFTFDDELVYVIKTDYSNMKKLYVYRITTVARPGGGATADYIILDYKEGTYEAYNYMLEEIEHKADQVKLDLLNIIDDANYAPVTYVNDSMKTVNETTREYVNGCVEDIVNDISAAEYATESYVNDKVFVLRTDFANNFAPLSYVNDKYSSLNSKLLEIESKDYATKESVNKVSNDLSKFKGDTLDYFDDHWQNIEWIKEDWAKKEYVDEKISNAVMGNVDLTGYATIEYVHTAISNISPGGGGSGDGITWEKLWENCYSKDYISDNYPTWDHLRGEINDSLVNYATKTYVDEAIANNGGSGGGSGDCGLKIIGSNDPDAEPHIFTGNEFTDEEREKGGHYAVLFNHVMFGDWEVNGLCDVQFCGSTLIYMWSPSLGFHEYYYDEETEEWIESYSYHYATASELEDVRQTIANKADKTHTHDNYADKSYVNIYVQGYVNTFLGDIESLLEEI